MRLRALLCTLLVVVACADDTDTTTAAPEGAGGSVTTGCAPGEAELADGSCLPAGVQPDGCAAGEGFVQGAGCVAAGVQADGCAAGQLGVDGACVGAGVAPDGCGAGFVHDGDAGCTPVLPTDACAEGWLAYLGETRCHAVRACAAGTWGDIPTNGSTVFVDASSVGPTSGTQAEPFRRIQDAVDAAAPGDVIAVAAGTYDEDIVIDLPVAIWGVCPEMVTLSGTVDAVSFIAGADGAELHAVAVTSAGVGIDVRGADAVLIEHVRVHDAGTDAIAVFDAAPDTGVILRDILVENASHHGIYVSGATAELSRVVVRGTQGMPDQGWGVTVLEDEATFAPASAVVDNLVLHDNREVGFFVQAATVSVTNAVVLNTRPNQSERFGRGFSIQSNGSPGGAANVDIDGVVIEGGYDSGILLSSSEAHVSNTVIRDISPNVNAGDHGSGIGMSDAGSGDPPTMTLRTTLIEHTSESGLAVAGGDLLAEGVAVRDVEALADESAGIGFIVQNNAVTGSRSTATMVGIAIERTREGGLLVSGSDATLRGILVRDVLPTNALSEAGAGIVAQDTDGERPNVILSGSLVERAHYMGVFLIGGEIEIDRVAVTDMSPQLATGAFGRGFAVQSNHESGAPAVAVLRGCAVERSHESALFVAGATATIEGARISDVAVGSPAAPVGRGLTAQENFADGRVSDVTLRYATIENTHEAAIFVAGGEVALVGVLTRGCSAVDDLFGDGLAVIPAGPSATLVTVQSSRIEDSARAGIASFGAQVSVENSALSCNPVPLNRESFAGVPAEFMDLGGNDCGCDGQDAQCRALSTNLSPPAPIGG